jgi:FtsZ-binding cell division protein ZapB
MISLEQIRLLEAKITKAVDLITSLREENRALKAAVESAQGRMQDLETLVEDFKADQSDIEDCIKRAIQNLDQLEGDLSDSVGQSGTDTTPQIDTPTPAADSTDNPADAPAEGGDAPSAAVRDELNGGTTRELDIF